MLAVARRGALALVGLAVVVAVACLTMPVEPAPLKPRNKRTNQFGWMYE